MAELTQTQLQFLASQNVPLDKTFDADGFPRSLYRQVMSCDDLWVAYGVTPCKAGNHSLRTRTGSCIQCSTAQLAFVKRWSGPGYIYVAYSADLATTKVGVTANPESRIRSLNSIGYGGAFDWILFNYDACGNMGLMEHRVHQELSAHRAHVCYWRDGWPVECREAFNCQPIKAWRLVMKSIKATA